MAATHLVRGELSLAGSYLRIARQRGPTFTSQVVEVFSRQPHALFIRLVERVSRMHLLPNGELARIRAAVLPKLGGASHEVDIRVAKVLSPHQNMQRVTHQYHAPSVIDCKRFIVAGSSSNPYVWMINAHLDTVGLTVHFVSGFSGLMQALGEAQENGEFPHVHLDTWLSRREAMQLTSALRPTSTLSVTAHDLEQNHAIRPKVTGASVLIERANAIHVLTRSALTRLGREELNGDARIMRVPHPSYYGPQSGSYGLPQDRMEARRHLHRDLSEFSVGLVGRISDRKNVELLLDAAEILHKMQGIKQQPRVYISGSLRTRFAERIVRRTAALPNVTLITDDLDDETAGRHAAALDAAVVPYHGYLNSGWTLLALSAGVPIIASRESTASEVVPADALTEFAEGDARSLAEAILSLVGRDRSLAERAARRGADEVHPNEIARLYAYEMAARIFRA